MQIDWNAYVEILLGLSVAAQAANSEQEPQKIADYRVYPQNQETDPEISLPDTSVEKPIDTNDIENGKPILDA